MKRIYLKIISVIGIIGMLSAMFLIESTNISLLCSCPCAIIAGVTIDSWWNKD